MNEEVDEEQESALDETPTAKWGSGINQKAKVKEESDTRIYEIGYLLIPGIGDEGVALCAEALRALLEKHGGTVISEEPPTKKMLSYRIEKRSGGTKQKYDNAYFGWIKFELLPENLQQVKKDADAHEDVMRFILIQTVRESTLMPLKPILARRPEAVDVRPAPREGALAEGVSERVPMSEEELDKTIEELVIE